MTERATKFVAAMFAPSAIIAWAFVLTIVGWAALWAVALGLVPYFPPGAAVAIFFVGLAAIPFGARANRVASTRDANPLAHLLSATSPDLGELS